jgi:hypothetical protein
MSGGLYEWIEHDQTEKLTSCRLLIVNNSRCGKGMREAFPAQVPRRRAFQPPYKHAQLRCRWVLGKKMDVIFPPLTSIGAPECLAGTFEIVA